MLDDFERRVVERRQALAEFGSGPAFDPGDQHTQHVVEDLDLLVVEAFPVMQEQICYLSKRRDPLLRRAAPDGVFEFVDDGMIQLVQDMPHVSCSARLALRKRRELAGNGHHGHCSPTLALRWRLRRNTDARRTAFTASVNAHRGW